jgi:uncharacterized protein (DUF1015 family)
VVKSLNGLSEEVFMEKVKENFDIEEVGEGDRKKEKNKIKMFIGNKWY